MARVVGSKGAGALVGLLEEVGGPRVATGLAAAAVVDVAVDGAVAGVVCIHAATVARTGLYA